MIVQWVIIAYTIGMLVTPFYLWLHKDEMENIDDNIKLGIFLFSGVAWPYFWISFWREWIIEFRHLYKESRRENEQKHKN